MQPAPRNLPEVSPQSILFPYDEQEERFRCSFYEEDMSYNQVSKKEIEDFFGGLNNTSPNFHNFKAYPNFVTPMMLSAIVGLFGGCMLILIGRYYASSTILVLLGVAAIIGGIYQGFRTVTKFIDSKETVLTQTRGQVSDYLVKNQEAFKYKGLQFKVPENHFEYVELAMLPTGKNKSLFSEKETTISDTRRMDSMLMDPASNMSKPLLSYM